MAFDLCLGDQELNALGVVDTLKAGFAELRPPLKIDPVEWGKRHRYLSPKETARPGPWDPDKTPWAKEILWELSDESPTQIVVCPKASQIGFTEIGFVWSGWSFDQDPGTMITLWPTDAFIKRQIKQRLDPYIEGCEPLSRLFGKKQSRSAQSTYAQKSSPAGEWIFNSAKSAANLRGTPAVRAMADEIDEAPLDLADQGDVVELLIGRLSDAGSRMKLFIPCTPTIEATSIVWKWWQQTDQRYFEVPCPFCGGFQKLEWERLTWVKGSPETAEYICRECDKGFREFKKPQFIPEGRFVATTKAQRRLAVGMTVNSMYAPLGSYSWIQMAAQFEAAGGRESELKTFFNIRLGLPWRQTTDAPTADQLEKNKEPMAPMVLPERCLAITAGGDVQGDRVEIRVWGWGRGLESWLLGKFIIDRFKSRADGDIVVRDPRPLQEIVIEIDRKVTQALWTRADGAKMGMQFGLMDVNFDTTWAWRLIQALGPRWGAVRGAGGAGEDQGAQKATRLLTVSKVEREKVKNLSLYRVSSPMAFSEFYRFLRQPRPDADTGEGTWEGFVHLPDDVDDEELAQLTADQQVFDTKKKKLVWQKNRDRNEAGDCRKYARAALEAKKISSWREQEWLAREAALKADAEKRAAEAEAKAATELPGEAPKARLNATRTRSPLVSGGD